MANPITTLAGNVIATFQDREAVRLYVVTKYEPAGALLTISDLATLDELEVHEGGLDEMMALFMRRLTIAALR